MSQASGATVQNLKDKAQEQVDKAASQIEDTAKSMAEQGREASENVQEVLGNVKGAVEKSLKDQPLTTLALTAAAGFIIGAIWKS